MDLTPGFRDQGLGIRECEEVVRTMPCDQTTGKPAQGFKSLLAWQRAMELVAEVYKLTKNFPPAELYGLTSQARRAAVSIPSNVAEGYGRRGRGDYVRFLDIARGSTNELETQLILACQLDLVTHKQAQPALDLVSEVQRILAGLVSKLRSSLPNP